MMVKSANRLKVAIAFLTFFACVVSAALIFIKQPIAKADDGEREVAATYILGEDVERMYGAKAVPKGEGYYTAVRGADGKFVYTYSDCGTGWAMAMRESTSADTPVLVKLVDNWIAEETDEIVPGQNYWDEGVPMQTSFGSDERGFWNGSIYIPEEKGVILDLNGYMIDRHRNIETATEHGSVISMGKNAFLEITDSYKGEIPDDEENKRVHSVTGLDVIIDDIGYASYDITSFTLKGGLITGGFTKAGGGVYAPSGGTIIMSGGTIAGNGKSLNQYEANGGGVYLYGQGNSPAAFMMNGGEIRNNIALEGGGLYLGGTEFTMTGGAIKNNNAANSGGGMYVDIYSTFKMNGGEISGNNAYEFGSGGGVYINAAASFTMSGTAKIINNNAGSDGGGVFSGFPYASHAAVSVEPITITGGEISGNTADGNGGGIAVAFSPMTMTGGKIKDNTSTDTHDNRRGGGGVFTENDFVMTGGEISGNISAGGSGGGVRVDGGTFTMSGSAKISGNTAKVTGGGGVGITQHVGKFIMNGGEISGNSVIGIFSTGGGGGVYTEGEFTLNNGKITGNTSDGSGGGVYSDSTMDINGFEMNGGEISGNIVYASTSGGIRGGGGVYLCGGKFTMKGGFIKDNSTGVVKETNDDDDNDNGDGESENTVVVKDAYGGGVCVIGGAATFTMTGGEISGNTTNGESNGGGVYADGSGEMFTMSGNAKISGNKAGQNGGGVYITTNNTKLTMSDDAEISNNTAYKDGGGVYITSTAELEMYDNAKVNDNLTDRGDGGGVYLSGGYLTMNSGEISGNETFPDNKGDVAIPNIGSGGGVYVGIYSNLTMRGGKIDNNLANGFAMGGDGGGVYLLGNFEFIDGEISNNKAAQMGGGIYMAGRKSGEDMITANVDMSGGKITGNEASGGGGILFGSGNLYLSGGEITGNRSWASINGGGGIHVSGSTNFKLSGSPKIYGNIGHDGFVDGDYVDGDSDVFLSNSDARFNLDSGMLSNDAYIGVRIHQIILKHHDGIFTNSYHMRHSEIDPSLFFFANDPNYVVIKTDGPEAKLVERVSLTVMLAYGDNTATLEEPNGYKVSYTYHYGYTVRYGVEGADESLDVTAIKVNSNSADEGLNEVAVNNITNAGEYKLLFTYNNVTKAYYVTINPFDLTDETVNFTAPDREFNNGEEVLPNLTAAYGGVTLVENTDYVIECTDNIYPGVATATVIFKGNYIGQKIVQYNITLEGGYYAVLWQYYRGAQWNNIDAATVFEFIPGERTDQSGNIRAVLTATFTGAEAKVKYAYAQGVTDYKDDIGADDLSDAKVAFEFEGEEIYSLINTGAYTLIFNAEKEDGLIISNNPRKSITVKPFNINDSSAEDRASMMDFRVDGASNITYNGKEKKPPITIYFDRLLLIEGVDFTVEYSNNIEAGRADVSVTFINNYVGTESGNFTIAKAQNGWDGQINVIRWSYGEFVADRNVFIAKTLYMSEGTNVHFSVLPNGIAQAERSADDPLTDISVERVVDTTYGECYKVTDPKAIAALKALNSGSYTMSVWVDATVSYEAIAAVEVMFDIFKSQNDWTNVPSIRGWHYSAYDAAVNAPYAEAKHGSVTLIVKNKDGEIIYDKESGLDKLGEQNVGEYTLIATVPESENFIGLNYLTTFAIAKSPNDWLDGELPRIESWVTGEYNGDKNVPIAHAVFGDVRVVITDKKGKVVYDSLNGTNNLAKLDADTYYLTATVEASENYYELSYSRQFTVFEKFGLPWWAVLLIALGTLAVAALIMLILHKTGVLQLFTEKMVVALRARADTDATIAAVRAGKYAAKKEKESAAQTKEEKKEIKRVETLNRRTDAAVNRAADVRARAAQQRTDKTPPTDKK